MRHTLFLAFLFLLSAKAFGQTTTLSPDAQVQILTAAPGEPLYSAFGHCAFRVMDRNLRLDRVYNYGTFDFRTPGFYMKFVRGKLPYFLSAEGSASFVEDYVAEGRVVKVQVLDLDTDEVQGVYDFLENNHLPENKFYAYDFFFDNCATRERDVLTDVLGDDLDWNAWPDDSLGSLRDLLDIYLAERPWEDFGIDLVLGMPADQEADQSLSMFLPDYLFLAVQGARVKTNSGWKPLVQETYNWVEPKQPFVVEAGPITPKLVFWCFFAFVLVLSVVADSGHPLMRLFDMLLFLVIGLLGMLMLFFWLFTDHQATYFNLNLLWALPTHVVFAFLRLARRNAGQRNYSRWTIAWYGMAAIAYLFIPQSFHAATLPLILALVTRMLSVAKATIDA